jgi:tripartite-type tricarboxylate transporter receptor subunit TctC
VAKLNAELRRFIAGPETKQMFEKSALLSMDADSSALTQYIAGEVKRWTSFVEEKGLKK